MSPTVHRRAAAFLRRVGLVAAVLAIMAGIFGMHALTATHAMHSPASATAAADTHILAGPPGHPGHQAAVSDQRVFAEQYMAGDGVGQCADSGDCPSMHATTVACTLSAKTASMTAPPPGTFVLEISNTLSAGAVTGQWSYLPGSPSPCELSISRT
jgi:hypothetical protein